MTSQSQIYSFPSYIQEAYTDVHQWLARQPDAGEYKKKARNPQLLHEKTLESAAAQYYTYFPAHYFKVAYTLKSIVPPEQLTSWLNPNSHICIVDIGCGAGTASAAFIEAVICLRKKEKLTYPLNIYCLGMDVNQYALVIYHQLMMRVKTKVSSLNVNLEYNVLPKGIGEGVFSIRQCLGNKREQWQQPVLSNVLMMQSNVIDFLENDYKEQQKEYECLKKLGISSEKILDDYEKFTQEYALAYKYLFEEVTIDRLHAITIGSKSNTSPYDDLRRIKAMANALEQTFCSSGHKVECVDLGTHYVHYDNPISSYWRNIRIDYHSDFHVNISTITSAKLEEDRDWNEVISIDNLELAWAKARRNFLTEVIFDEVEIRLFENQLDENLKNLQKQLMAYIEDVACSGERISYKFPKNSSNTRPRLLSRMEEEILSTAIIQKLGYKADGLQSSYAHRLARRNGNRQTEYLYEPWFNSYYDRFMVKTRESALKHDNGVVLQIDIKSYYTEIIQDQLIELTSQELRTKSERILWLLRILLSKGLDGHEDNRGLSQGSIGSGFYANIYLTSIDARFGSENNEWDVQYHRFADDIMLVIPNPEDVNSVRGAIEEELGKIGLSLNTGKTKIYQVPDFLEKTEADEILRELSDSFKKLITPLEVMNYNYRNKFRNYYVSDEKWWYFLDRYCQCLQSINIYVTKKDLSRKIYKYIFKSEKQLKQELQLTLPELPNTEDSPTTKAWPLYFKEYNPDWIAQKDNMRDKLINLFGQSLQELKQLDESNYNRDRAERRVRFAVNRLCMLGFAEIQEELLEILCNSPWIFRTKLSYFVESLARQGCGAEIMKLLTHYAKQYK